MSGQGGLGDFDGIRSYFRSLRLSITSGYSFKPRSIEDEDRERLEGGGTIFKRTLTSLQLICLGIGTQLSCFVTNKCLGFLASQNSFRSFAIRCFELDLKQHLVEDCCSEYVVCVPQAISSGLVSL